MSERRVSIIITTYNRREALAETLRALANQTISGQEYEILVVDNGCSDGTSDLLDELTFPCGLKTFSEPSNVGISAARNVALRAAKGRYIIFVSDDLIVPRDFIAKHIETLETFPGFWVVGGFQQLESLTETPFGRYLDELERRFEEGRKTRPLAPGIWEMSYPTARNLSLPRSDLEKTGLFDEQFHDSCEDQDLAEGAKIAGIRFLYNAGITCVHNDQAGELKRYCQAQRRGARDTVLFCAKYPTTHGEAEIARINGCVSKNDSLKLAIKKLLKSVIASGPVTAVVERGLALAERYRAPDWLLWEGYRLLIGVYIFRGWREGLASSARGMRAQDGQRIGYHSDL